MEEKIRELLACYHLEIKRLYRGRGAWLCETDQGLKLLRVYHGSPKHLQWEMMVKACLRERGYVYIDQFMANQEGAYLTPDDEGQNYVLTDWYEGRECSTRDKEEILKAVAHMAGMHKGMHDITRNEEFYEVFCQENFWDEMARRRRELKTIRNYIYRKKQKNAFDRRFMEVYQEFDEAGARAQEVFQMRVIPKCMRKAAASSGCVMEITRSTIFLSHAVIWHWSDLIRCMWSFRYMIYMCSCGRCWKRTVGIRDWVWQC